MYTYGNRHAHETVIIFEWDKQFSDTLLKKEEEEEKTMHIQTMKAETI